MVVPTPEQIAIRDEQDLDLLVLAAAGCGKTEALALRVAGLIDRGQIRAPQRVLVTTFSNRARDNIKERLATYVSPAKMSELVTVSNFHGLAARIFRAHANVIAMRSDLTIPESDWVGDQCISLGLDFPRSSRVQDLLRQAKQQPFDDEQVERWLLEAGDSIALELERQRKSEGRLSYDDLPRVAELILQNETVAGLYRSHFAACVVDEFQDLTPQQLRIVNQIGHGRTTYAGDLAQGIYGFAGSAPDEVLHRIGIECSRTIEFSLSHRSSPAVLDAVNALASRTGGRALTSADPARWPGGGLAGQVEFASTGEEATWAVRFARYVLRRAPGHRIGVISRTASRRRFADSEFSTSGLPVHRWDEGLLDTDTARIVKSMLARLDAAELNEAEDPRAYLRIAADIDGVHEPMTRKALVDALDWSLGLLQDGVAPEAIKARIRVGDGVTLASMPGVHLLTGHSGKGQQFDWVVVLGAEEGCIPDFRATTPATKAEEARVFSVMLSRARHGVAVLHARSVEASNGRPWPKQPSSFLSDFQGVPTWLTGDSLSAWLNDAPWDRIAGL